MAINLHSKYDKKIQEKFYRESLIAGRLSRDYDWRGVKTVKISTPVTVALNDYTRSGINRYGTPEEMQDVVQELTLTQDKSFAMTIDKGNNADQNYIKEAGKMLALQIREKCVPALDKYVFNALAQQAGNIVAASAALTKSNVTTMIDDAIATMGDAEVPEMDRTLFVSYATLKLMKQAAMFDMHSDKVATEAIVRGKVGEYSNMDVVAVPAGRFPANVNFMIVYKNSAVAPLKLDDTKIHLDPPGISGNLLEGRQYYDCFVFGAKCDGVYVNVANTATVLTAPTISTAGVITATEGASVKYTVDGSDPRYSSTAAIGTTVSAGSGTVVKAYQYKAGAFPSAVATQTIA